MDSIRRSFLTVFTANQLPYAAYDMAVASQRSESPMRVMRSEAQMEIPAKSVYITVSSLGSAVGSPDGMHGRSRYE